MVIIMKPGTKQERIQTLVTQLEQEHGVKVGITNGVGCSILGLVGDTTHIDMDKLSMNDDVERVMRVQEPFKKSQPQVPPGGYGGGRGRCARRRRTLHRHRRPLLGGEPGADYGLPRT